MGKGRLWGLGGDVLGVGVSASWMPLSKKLTFLSLSVLISTMRIIIATLRSD